MVSKKNQLFGDQAVTEPTSIAPLSAARPPPTIMLTRRIRNTFRPSASQALSPSREAASSRPNGDRDTTRTRTKTAAQTAPQNNVYAHWYPVNDKPRADSSGCGMEPRPVVPLNRPGVLTTTS